MDITVVVPCFNSEKTLERCLNSLINQSIEVSICVIDDGSSDKTLEIARGYESNNPNIFVLSQENRGLPQTRKVGVGHSTTKYTAFVDSDDWVEPDMMEQLYKLAEKYDAEIAACELFYEKNGKTLCPHAYHTGETVTDGVFALKLIHERKAVYPYMCNKLFLTEIAKQLEFPHGNFVGEDYITLCSWIEKCQHVAVTSKAMYHYELKIGSMSKNGFGLGHKRAFEHYQTAYNKYAQTHTQKQSQEMANYLCVEYAALVVAMARNMNVHREILGKIQKFLLENRSAFLKSDTSWEYKLSALLISINPFAFIHAYRLLGRLQAH